LFKRARPFDAWDGFYTVPATSFRRHQLMPVIGHQLMPVKVKEETFKDYFADAIRFKAMFLSADGSQHQNLLRAFHQAADKFPCSKPRIENWHLTVFAPLKKHVEEIYKTWEILFRGITHDQLTTLKIKYVWGKEGNPSTNYDEGFLQHCMSMLDESDSKERTWYKFFTRYFGPGELAKWQSVADWKNAMLKANEYYNENSLKQQEFRERTAPPLTVAFAIFAAVHAFAWFLRAKDFILCPTDCRGSQLSTPNGEGSWSCSNLIILQGKGDSGSTSNGYGRARMPPN
jgi:hypothetical protein